MIFNSLEFFIFLPVVFILYWFVFNKNIKQQNFLILIASYFFYGWWDWRFLSLIAFSSLVDYFVGLELVKFEDKNKRKSLLWTSILVNLGLLGIFKYYNFFLDNFQSAFSFFGHEISGSSLDIILPVGISFYTFQTLSYTIDVYKRKLQPSKDIVAFSAFVCFFPQLVAGPIERATNLLPQFYKNRILEYNKAVDGLRQILWGLFKKIVIADNCAIHVNECFNNYENYSGSTLAIGALFFTFQIYADFSGYSDIAIGTSRLFGFNLKQNFAFPYFSRDIAEFWRRWHISLSTWFRDYLYIPIGGSKGGHLLKTRNVFIIFIVSGFWHGANWTFMAWGTLNALYFLPLLLFNKKNRKHIHSVAEGRFLPNFKEFTNILMTFGLTVFTWIFFRADNMDQAIGFITILFSKSFFTIPTNTYNALPIFLTLFIFIEWIGRGNQYAIANFGKSWNKEYRHLVYYILILLILYYFGSENEFIYFQF